MAEMSTGELQAVIAKRYPNSWYLHADLEEACATIKEKGDCWGDIHIPAQGPDGHGNLLVKFFEIQMRRFRQKVSKKHVS
jgi:hypothetical protein